MVRGLSEHQKTALILALENVLIENRNGDCLGCDLYEFELLATMPAFAENLIHPLRHSYYGYRTSGDCHFKVSAIKHQHYKDAFCSVETTFDRLEQQGLVIIEIHGQNDRGINFTDNGFIEACSLCLETALVKRVAERVAKGIRMFLCDKETAEQLGIR